MAYVFTGAGAISRSGVTQRAAVVRHPQAMFACTPIQSPPDPDGGRFVLFVHPCGQPKAWAMSSIIEAPLDHAMYIAKQVNGALGPEGSQQPTIFP